MAISNKVDQASCGGSWTATAGYYVSDHIALSGTLTHARGRRTDVADDLYRLAPPNGRVALSYEAADWLVRVEAVAYAAQKEVAPFNGETPSPGYGILTASTTWQVGDRLMLMGGVFNVFDKDYRDHLDGINRGADPDVAIGERLPGAGRNIRLSLRYEW